MFTDRERCVRAVQSKDARFDGWFFTAVTTTGIYCRPSCPAVAPKPQNMCFYPTAAAAQRAGFRACKRCRPDATPGSPEWDRRADVVARAMRLVSDGVVDRDGVGGLARRLGYSTRQLERQLVAELGAGPLALARAQRAHAARLLIETTSLAFGEVAFAAGFASIRQFNDTVRDVFALTPRELRRRAAARAAVGGRRAAGGTRHEPGPAATLALRLPFRRPMCAAGVLGHLAATAVPGVEEWLDGAYRRTMRLPHGHGVVSLTAHTDHVACRLRLGDVRDLSTAIARCRRLLDLDADPVAVDDALGDDPVLAPLVAAAPGRRVPRTVDGAEYTVRCVLGQQVSTAAARTHAARLVARLGEPLAVPDDTLTHLWPEPVAIAEADPALLSMPAGRRRTVVAVAGALAEGRIDVGSGGDWQQARAELGAIEGVGPWTVEHVCMRALGDPDAFPATDLGVRAAAGSVGLPTTSGALVEHAGRWRPWRSYAVQYLWSTVDHPINRLSVAADGRPPKPANHEPASHKKPASHNKKEKEDVMPATSRSFGPKGKGRPGSDRPAGGTTTRRRPSSAAPACRHTVVDSPIGPLTLVDSDGVLVGLHMDAQRHRPADDTFGRRDDGVQRRTREQLEAYFEGDLQEFDVPMAAEGTPFQQEVWAALRRIPYGATVSYGELAACIDRPGASRAVGLANGRNPIGIVVPCHRVIGAAGDLTGYGGGLDRKRWLLEHEAAVSSMSGRR